VSIILALHQPLPSSADWHTFVLLSQGADPVWPPALNVGLAITRYNGCPKPQWKRDIACLQVAMEL
jgi:hypothetical protein